MPEVRRRLGAALAAVLTAVLVLGLSSPAASAAKDPPGRVIFMRALATVESGGRYTARNATTGAYGKYQILPTTWRMWARRYLGDAAARPTPANQERVARAAIASAYWRYRSWPVVAHYWLTGRGERDSRKWSSRARRYVDKVMGYYARYGGTSGTSIAPAAAPPSPTTSVPETSSLIAYGGGWADASHRGYAGGHVRWTSAVGATATFTFTGSRVTWVGPKGPTRGRVRVLVDGAELARVDLREARFRPTVELFTASFPEPGEHVLTLEVLPAPGRSVVAIDAFLVRP